MALGFAAIHNFATLNEQVNPPYDNNGIQAVIHDRYLSLLILSFSLREQRFSAMNTSFTVWLSNFLHQT